MNYEMNDGMIGISDDRLQHVRGVATRAYQLSKRLFGWDENKAQEMFFLGFVHDAGYQFSANQRQHEERGGNILRRSGYNYWREVYYHGSPGSPYQSDELFILNLADMQTSGKGERVSLQQRLDDIAARYGYSSEQYIRARALADELIDRLDRVKNT